MVTLVDAAAVVLVAGILVTLGESVRRGDVAALVNALVSLAAALVPIAAARWLPVWQGWAGPTTRARWSTRRAG